MAFTRTEFTDFVADQRLQVKTDEKTKQLVESLSRVEHDLFQGKEEIQPLKWHQLKRLFRLAKGFIEIMVILWPYIKMIVKMFKK